MRGEEEEEGEEEEPEIGDRGPPELESEEEVVGLRRDSSSD